MTSALRSHWLSVATVRCAEPSRPWKKRGAPLSVRLSPKERAALEAAANGAPLASYVKSRLFGAPIPKHRARGANPVKDYESLGRVLGLLGQSRMASNLNQIARAANMGMLVVPAEAAAELHEACRAIIDMRAELLRALGVPEGPRDDPQG